jgi:hypothetical protein
MRIPFFVRYMIVAVALSLIFIAIASYIPQLAWPFLACVAASLIAYQLTEYEWSVSVSITSKEPISTPGRDA